MCAARLIVLQTRWQLAFRVQTRGCVCVGSSHAWDYGGGVEKRILAFVFILFKWHSRAMHTHGNCVRWKIKSRRNYSTAKINSIIFFCGVNTLSIFARSLLLFFHRFYCRVNVISQEWDVCTRHGSNNSHFCKKKNTFLFLCLSCNRIETVSAGASNFIFRQAFLPLSLSLRRTRACFFTLYHRQQSCALWANDKSSINWRKFDGKWQRNRLAEMKWMWLRFAI